MSLIILCYLINITNEDEIYVPIKKIVIQKHFLKYIHRLMAKSNTKSFFMDIEIYRSLFFVSLDKLNKY